MRAAVVVLFAVGSSIGCMHNNQSEWLSSDGSEQTSTMPQADTEAAPTGVAFAGSNGDESSASAPSPATSTSGCTFDNECSSGSCEFGQCSAFSKNSCAFDSQCGTGSCQFGQCSPFAR